MSEEIRMYCELIRKAYRKQSKTVTTESACVMAWLDKIEDLVERCEDDGR